MLFLSSIFHTLLASVCLSTAVALADGNWKPLFNGTDLSGWDMFMIAPDPSWEVPGMEKDTSGQYKAIGKNCDPLKVFNIGQINGRPTLHITGQGFGVITTRESFGNFHLQLKVKWGERKWGIKLKSPRDSGLLYWVHSEPGVVDSTWPRSLEFQIQENDTGDLFALGSRISVHARKSGKLWIYDPTSPPVAFSQKTQTGNRCVKANNFEHPNDEWNTLDLICFNGDAIYAVNGHVVMRLHQAERLDGSAPAPLREGHISLQTEGAEVYYQDVRIRTIDAIPTPFLP